MGYLYFYSPLCFILLLDFDNNSRPLWGIYISILKLDYNRITSGLHNSRPLWGIYISIRIVAGG